MRLGRHIRRRIVDVEFLAAETDRMEAVAERDMLHPQHRRIEIDRRLQVACSNDEMVEAFDFNGHDASPVCPAGGWYPVAAAAARKIINPAISTN